MKKLDLYTRPPPGLFPKSTSANTTEYGGGELIFAEGSESTAMFRIERGFVKLTVPPNKKGSRPVAFILGAGDCFGENLLLDACRTCTATSLQQSMLQHVSRQEVVQRLKEPACSKQFITYLLHRIGRSEADLIDSMNISSEMRLAKLLLQLSETRNGAKSDSALLEIDQETLAQVVGTTRSRVSHFMNGFRRDGLIDYNGTLQVNKGLQKFVER